ncbi:MAG TPA: M23 family metallopeptidase, partial [Spirochaetota bacterium]
MKRINITLIMIALGLICSQMVQAEEGILNLPSIDNRDDISPITSAVRQGVVTVRGKKNPAELPELRFYQYRVRNSDSFWKILSRTTLNVDTVMSINNLSSPYDVKPGNILYLPTMRGIIHECVRGEKIDDIEAQYGVPREYIYAANRITTLSKRFIFIPCGEVTSLERSLFIGTGFAAPMEHLRRTSGFGLRKDPFTGEKAFHSGVDLGCSVNTPVYAARAGKVIFTGYKGDY